MPTLDVAINASGAIAEAKKGEEAVEKWAVTNLRFDLSIKKVDDSLKRIAESGYRSYVYGAQQAQTQTERTSAAVTGLGTAAERAGRQINLSLGGLAAFAGSIAVIRQGVETAGQFEESLVRLAHAATEPTDPLEKQAEAVGRLRRALLDVEGFRPTQAAQAALELSKAGLSIDQALRALPPTLNLARVATLGLGESAAGVADILDLFNLPASQAAHVVDVLGVTSKRANTPIKDLIEGLKEAGPVATAAKIPFDQVAAAIGVLGDNEVKGTEGGAQFRQFLLSLINPSTDAQKALAALGVSTTQLAALQKGDLLPLLEHLARAQLSVGEAANITNNRVASTTLILSGNADAVRRIADENATAAGEVKAFSDEIGNTLHGRIESLKGAYEKLSVSAGDAGFLGAIKATVSFLESGVSSFGKFGDELTAQERAAQAATIALGTSGLAGAALFLARVLTPGGAMFTAIAGVSTLLVEYAVDAVTAADKTELLIRKVREADSAFQNLEIARKLASERGDVEDEIQAITGQIKELKQKAVELQKFRDEKPGETKNLQLFDPTRTIVPNGPEFERAISEALRVLELKRSELSAKLGVIQAKPFEFKFSDITQTEDELKDVESRIRKINETIGRTGLTFTDLARAQIELPVEGLQQNVETAIDRLQKRVEDLRANLHEKTERAKAEADAVAKQVREKGKDIGEQLVLPLSNLSIPDLQDLFKEQAKQVHAQNEAREALRLYKIALVDDAKTVEASNRARIQAATELAGSGREIGDQFSRISRTFGEDIERAAHRLDEQERAILTARQDFARAGLDLSRGEESAIRDVVRRRQDAAEAGDDILRAVEMLEDAGRQLHDLREGIDAGIGRDFAASIVDPLRQAVADGKWEDVGEQIARRISFAAVDNLALKPLENALGSFFKKFAEQAGLGELQFKTAVAAAGADFFAKIELAGTILAARLAAGGGANVGAAALSAFGNALGSAGIGAANPTGASAANAAAGAEAGPLGTGISGGLGSPQLARSTFTPPAAGPTVLQARAAREPVPQGSRAPVAPQREPQRPTQPAARPEQPQTAAARIFTPPPAPTPPRTSTNTPQNVPRETTALATVARGARVNAEPGSRPASFGGAREPSRGSTTAPASTQPRGEEKRESNEPTVVINQTVNNTFQTKDEFAKTQRQLDQDLRRGITRTR